MVINQLLSGMILQVGGTIITKHFEKRYLKWRNPQPLKTWEPILGPPMQGECPTTIEELLGTVLGINLEGPWLLVGSMLMTDGGLFGARLMVYNWVYTNKTYAKIA